MDQLKLANKLVTREWDEYDITEDTIIDRYALDINAEKHPSNVLKWQELLVQANEICTKAKENLIFIEATLLLQARSDGVPGILKITDAVVRAWVVTQKEYQIALKEKQKAESDASRINAGIKALEHTKEMIKVEANLWICGYYARPNIKEAVKEEQQDQRRRDTSNELKKALQKRKLRTRSK